jgi:redox-sensitive bicupin YhaK (pirin superfamily)
MTPYPVPAGLNHPFLITHDLTHDRLGAALSPFLIISYFDMTGPVFPPHPHAGFSVATYILPESPTGFWNRDTLGTHNRIAPGSLHWSVAGAGLMHEETVMRSGKLARGFQIWIDHPDALRQVPPAALHVAGNEMSVTTTRGVTRRLVIGRDGATTASVATPVDVTIIDISAEPMATWTETVEAGHHAWAWVLHGQVEVDGQSVAAGEALLLSFGRQFVASAVGVRLILFSGRPTGSTVVQGGPFVGSSRAEIEAFHARYRSGGMGRLPAFDQAAIDRAFDAAQQNIA